MEKGRKTKIGLIAALITSLLALIGLICYVVARELNAYEGGMTVKDEDAMLVGTYRTSSDQDGNEYANRIHVRIVSGGSVVERMDVRTDSSKVVTLDGVDDIVFVDITDTLKSYTNNLGYSFWYRTSPSRNYVTCSVECLGTGYTSAEKTISDSGYFAANVPTADGENVEMKGGTIYRRNIVGWGG